MEDHCHDAHHLPAVQGATSCPHAACPSCGAYNGRQYAEAVRTEHEAALTPLAAAWCTRDRRTGVSAAAAPLVEKLGVHLDPELLVLALTHRSFAHEAGGIPTNERLEFLGDTVLGLVVTEALYRAHPGLSEGELAKMRAATVSQRALAAIARDARTWAATCCSARASSPPAAGTRTRSSSDTLEALFGAVYLTHGLETARDARRAARRTRRSTVAADLGAGLDWKTSLQELAAALGLGAPEYECDGRRARTTPARSPRAIVLDGEVRGHRDRAAPRSSPSRRPPRPPTRRSTRCRARRAGPRPPSTPDGPAVPELPEVETVRDGLARHVLGRTVARGRGAPRLQRPAARRRAARLRRPPAPGARSTAAVRRGKFLWLLLDARVDGDGARWRTSG